MMRKNKKFIDPRYFMDEKMELNEALDNLTGYPTTGPGAATATPTATADWRPTEVDIQLQQELSNLNMDWIEDEISDALTQLASNSNSRQEYIQKIKAYLNSVADEIGYANLGDEVLETT